MKLDLKHLSPYLPYKLEMSEQDLIYVLAGFDGNVMLLYEKGDPSMEPFGAEIIEQSVKPILRPLSDYCDINSTAMNELNCDLTDQIQINELANKKINYSQLNYGVAQICFQNHIDIFALIENGLAIDINTL